MGHDSEHVITISIASEFSDLPGPRYVAEGDHSGEAFREGLLKPKYQEAVRTKAVLRIELDGAKFGYPTSFLEEAFGGLARQFGINEVLAVLDFRSSEEPTLGEEITRYIREADKTSVERNRAGGAR